MDDVRARHLSQCHVRHWIVCCETRENVTCEGVLFTLTVRCSRLLSAVNDLTTIIFFEKVKIPLWVSWWVSIQNKFMSSTSVHSTGWRRRRMPPLVSIKRNWFKSLFSRFTVETVHICKCFSEVWSEFRRCISAWFVQWDITVFPISLELIRWWSMGVILLCQFIHFNALLLSPANFEFRITMLNLVGSDREFLQISFWDITSTHSKPDGTLRFCHAEHHT